MKKILKVIQIIHCLLTRSSRLSATFFTCMTSTRHTTKKIRSKTFWAVCQSPACRLVLGLVLSPPNNKYPALRIQTWAPRSKAMWCQTTRRIIWTTLRMLIAVRFWTTHITWLIELENHWLSSVGFFHVKYWTNQSAFLFSNYC